ncbi:MAG TPA: sodium ion-translocating decarboxylase subunit beta, partial [Spirochaetales bacterium]|nr:sodium ion-translocating decarboxylase subunit beta [Spirochaetales bacterium]
MWQNILEFLQSTGFAAFGNSSMMVFGVIPGELIMIVVACVLLYLGIAKKFEPLLLVPIAFGML